MNYEYIEQLLERYFECLTSLEEEQILRAFFAQENVPARLLSYRPLFTEAARQGNEETLGSDFDEKILTAIGKEEKPLKVKAIKVSLRSRLSPLYKAVACVAVVLAIGQAAQVPYDRISAEQDSIARLQQIEKDSVRQDGNRVAQNDSSAVSREPQGIANWFFSKLYNIQS